MSTEAGLGPWKERFRQFVLDNIEDALGLEPSMVFEITDERGFWEEMEKCFSDEHREDSEDL